MASATCKTSNGVRSAAAPFKVASSACVTRVGVASAASRVAWAGATGAKKNADWLPPQHIPPVVPDGKGGWRWNPVVYKAISYLFEQVVGGINGKTLPEAIRELQQTQAELVATTNYAEQVGTYAQSVATTVQAVTQVAQSNGLTGAESVPEPAEPPSRAVAGTQVQ